MTESAPDTEPEDEPKPLPDRAATLRAERAEIAEEPGNHGVFAIGCSIAVIVVLAAFFLVRLLLMR